MFWKLGTIANFSGWIPTPTLSNFSFQIKYDSMNVVNVNYVKMVKINFSIFVQPNICKQFLLMTNFHPSALCCICTCAAHVCSTNDLSLRCTFVAFFLRKCDISYFFNNNKNYFTWVVLENLVLAIWKQVSLLACPVSVGPLQSPWNCKRSSHGNERATKRCWQSSFTSHWTSEPPTVVHYWQNKSRSHSGGGNFQPPGLIISMAGGRGLG